ncbi:MAG: polymer-forming cytoskeletal protein [Pseudomonadota bacterium]
MAIMRKEDVSDPNIQIGQTHTVLGPESSFDGKLTFQGAVRIDGKFSGEVVTDDVLVVGDGAKVKAEIKVGSLVLNGEIEGNVTAKGAVQIHAPGVLRGNITTPSLTIDRGVVFEGSCHMENIGQAPKTLTSSPKPATPPPGDGADAKKN